MPLEAEFLPIARTIVYGVCIALAISAGWLWKKSLLKGSIASFFVFHLAALGIGFNFLFGALQMRPDVPMPMASEENSLQLGAAGLFWLIAMASLFFALLKAKTLKVKRA